jgi:hypothetical protein
MTRQTPDLPDWIHEGAKVALLRGRHPSIRVTRTTVVRMTATQIVLANGDRYRRDTLREVGKGYDSPDLLPADHPKVVAVIRGIRLRDAIHAVRDAAEKLRFDADPAAAIDGLDAIEAAVAAARAAASPQPAVPAEEG